MGVEPGHCVVVEDSPAGIAAAKSAGMRVVAFTGGSHAQTPRHRETLLSLKPDALFDDMRELLQFVRTEKADGKEH
jgi:beta-phosphoglucomutase-like phosphatase (HAD superfamily)